MTTERFLDVASLSILWLLVSLIVCMIVVGIVAGICGAGDDFPEER